MTTHDAAQDHDGPRHGGRGRDGGHRSEGGRRSEGDRHGDGGRGHDGGRRGDGGRRRQPRRRLHVVSTRPVSEHLVRIVATGELQDWEVVGAGGHFKLFLPQDGGETATRTYTVRAYDRERAELTIDFAVHDDGPATRFATRAAPGAEFEVSGGSRPGFSPRPGSTWTVLLADQSALPAVCAILERLPAGHSATVWLEVPAESDVVALPSEASVDAHWLVQSGETNDRLVQAGLALSLPDGDGEVWVGCEAGAMRTVRRHVLGELGMRRDDVHTRAYWKRGVVAHSDHDTGDDVEGDR